MRAKRERGERGEREKEEKEREKSKVREIERERERLKRASIMPKSQQRGKREREKYTAVHVFYIRITYIRK